MSIAFEIDSMSEQSRIDVVKKLTFQNETNNIWINAYYVKDDYCYIPYSFARDTFNMSPPDRKTFSKMNLEFDDTIRLREEQISVKTEAIRALNKQGSCVLSIYCGFGKSFLSIYIACKLKMKTLVVVNRIILVEQWKESLKIVCPGSKVQYVTSKKEIDVDCDFYIINAQNIPKKEHGCFSDIGTLIVDEVHTICAQTLYKALFHICPRYSIALSATPTRPDGLDCLIDLYFGKSRIVRKLHREHIAYQIQTDYDLKYDLNWKGKIDWNSLLCSQAEHKERNELIISIVKKFPSRHFLILCKRISQGKELYDRLSDENIDVEDLLGKKQEYNKGARVIIATIQKGGTGFDCPSLDSLILASDVKEYFIQYLGRIFRKKDHLPVIFDIVDKHPILQKHWQSRRKVYIEAGGKIKRVSKENLNKIRI
jgi:superfamily II DNA or RNA helicase